MQLRAGSAIVVLALVAACGGSEPRAGTPQGAPSSASEPRWPNVPSEFDARFAGNVPAGTSAPLLEVLSAELERSFEILRNQEDPAHYLAYQVTEQRSWLIEASQGALLGSTTQHGRSLDVDLRVGTPERDSTHRLPGEHFVSTFRGVFALPIHSQDQALVDALWLATDREYELSRQQWMRVQANEQIKETTEGAPPPTADFSREPPVQHVLPVAELSFDPEEWEQRLRRLSRVAEHYPEMMESSASLEVLAETRSFVSSDGGRTRVGDRRIRLVLQVATLAEDGMRLERFETFDVRSLDGLPREADLQARFQQLFGEVRALSKAPLIDPYAGPAILEGRAAGVFFHEIFGHRIEGHRQDADSEGQTFASLVGQQIMSPTLDVYDDPRLFAINGVELNGHYAIDDEGVPAQRADLVEAGVLRTFLLSRAPTRGFSRSNGHGRRQPGHAAVARQANLVVEPVRAVSRTSLEQALLREVERQGLPYGLRFSEITGGFTQTQRYDTQAFKVIPVMVFKVLPDGTEQLVRGVDIEGTPLTALSKITLAANDYQTFNGVCGAESGWVPVSATSPSILVSQIEVARQEQSELRPPLLPPPGALSASRFGHEGQE